MSKLVWTANPMETDRDKVWTAPVPAGTLVIHPIQGWKGSLEPNSVSPDAAVYLELFDGAMYEYIEAFRFIENGVPLTADQDYSGMPADEAAILRQAAAYTALETAVERLKALAGNLYPFRPAVQDYEWATSKAAVHTMMAAGWEPLGGITFTPEGHPVQAMVKR